MCGGLSKLVYLSSEKDCAATAEQGPPLVLLARDVRLKLL